MQILYKTVILQLDIYVVKWKHVHKKICTWIFTEGSFIIAKLYRCPSIENSLKELLSVHTIEYMSPIRNIL